jgi:predicted GIY-YIG superfamily endonuclease
MVVCCEPRTFVRIMSLLCCLHEFRQARAISEKIPLYCVFGDTVMRAISQTRPESLQALGSIRGFSDEKCAKYGAGILQLVNDPANKDESSERANSTSVVVRFGRGGKKSLLQKKYFVPKVRQYEGKAASPSTALRTSVSCDKDGIYVLELAHGRVYVGHSANVRRRIQQHMAGQGSAFTKAFPPTGVLLPRLGRVSGSAEAAERDETLRYMFLRGIQLVRGWKYVRVEMPEAEMQDAEENIRELFDLCRRCGHPGHFVTQCRSNYDRLGRPCRRA